MRWIDQLVLQLRSLFRRARVEQELDAELRFHLEQQIDEHVAAGMSAIEARSAALRSLGSLTRVKEQCRDSLGVRLADDLRQDLRQATRTFTKHPGFALIAVLILTLGIGVNTAIFSVLNAASLRASAIRDPDRVAFIWTTPSGHPESSEGVRLAEYYFWKAQSRAFDRLGIMLAWSSTVGPIQDGMPAERLSGWRFSASMFDGLGVQPELGRLFTEEEDRTDGPSNVVVISDRLWQSHFGGDPSVLNRTLLMDGTTTTIIGVMPPTFNFFGSNFDFWLPQNFTRFQMQARSPSRVPMAIGRVKPGVSLRQAQSEMDALAARLAQSDPELQKGRGVRLQPLDDVMLGWLRRLMLVLQGAVGFVLLIACANVAGLFLLRAASQQREVAIRCSLGANRVRILRQFLTESLLLSVAGGVLGVALAWSALRLLAAADPQWLSAVPHLDVDARVLAVSTAMVVLTALACGVVPALQVSNTDVARSLRESARATGGRTRRRIQSGLVVAQVALTLVLLVGAGLLIKSFWHLQRADLGFESHDVLSFDTRLPANKYFRQVGVRNGFTQLEVSPVPAMLFDRVAARIAQLPGVQSAAGINIPPLNGGGLGASFTVEGRPTVDAAGARENLGANYWLVTPNFFSTLRIPVIRGRDLTAADTAGSLPVAIVNQALARRLWPQEDPIGKRLTITIIPDQPPREIVGVVGDLPLSRWNRTRAPSLYVPQLQESLQYRVPYGQSRISMTFVLRLTQSPDIVIPAVRRTVADVDKSLPVAQIQLLDDALARQVEAPRDSMVAVVTFGMIALLLAMFGIYGVVAYAVVQRAREIGIRIALGATARSVVRLVLGQGIRLVLVGLILGVAGALALTRFLAAVLWDVTATDPVTFVAVVCLLTAVAALACLVPTRRALRLNPTVVLSTE